MGSGSHGFATGYGTTSGRALLEAELAEFVGAETGLVFATGYAANLGVVTALAGRGTLVVSDAGSHASLVEACMLSRARVAIAPHRDVDAIERLLADRAEERALVSPIRSSAPTATSRHWPISIASPGRTAPS